MQCGIFNAISKKNFRYSRFVKRIIAIEAQLYFLDLVEPQACLHLFLDFASDFMTGNFWELLSS